MGEFDCLSSADLRSVLACVRELYCHADLETSPKRFMAATRKLVACDSAAYEELNRTLERTVGANDPPDARPTNELLDVFADYASRGEHPIIGYWMKNPRQWRRAVSISQVKSRTDYHHSGIYNDVYRHYDAEDQLGLQLTPGGGPLMVAMAVTRSRRGFAERDRLVLQLLQPHLAQAYFNAAEMTRLRAEACASNDAIELAGAGVVRISDERAILACSPAGRRHLQDYCAPWRKTSRLPERIARWVRQQRKGADDLEARAPLVLPSENGRLIVRLAWDRRGIGSLLILEEQTARRAGLDQLTSTLPPRLRELLGHLLAGDGEKQAAAKMRLSRNTVHNYVTTLYRRLNVSTRSELMARCLRQNFKSEI